MSVALAPAPPQTPSDWLLDRHDQRVANQSTPTNHVRPLVELIDDHETDPRLCRYCNPKDTRNV